MVLQEIIQRGASEYPGRVAIRFHEEALSYGELAERISRCAHALRERGIGRGDRVGLLLVNCPESVIAYYGITAVGAVCVPVNPQLKPAELSYIWNDSNVRLAFVTAPLLKHALEARRALAKSMAIVSVGVPPEPAVEVSTFAELLDGAGAKKTSPADLDQKDPAVCMYTSGTTGRPKGALLSHRNLISNCEQVRAAINAFAGDNFLCALPLFHSFAGTVCQNVSLFCGASMTILEMFHPVHVAHAIGRHRVTIFPGVPTMFGAMLKLPNDVPVDLSSVRLVVSGGAPMPQAVMKAFEESFGIPIVEGDGPTECSPVTSVNPPDGVRKPGSIGLPLTGVQMKIFDDDDREVPAGEIGEIVVRGDNVMIGYHNNPDATAEAMRNGWYHTGDLGRMDEDGYFYIVDRKKDMIIVGGINVYPREIEEVLYSHPAVADAAVIGMPDEKRGEMIVALIVLKTGATARASDITSYCRERLANFKVPRRVLWRESLPRSGTGKVLKRLLRKEMELGAESAGA
jgi:long-chain acyl-CoA synthetase